MGEIESIYFEDLASTGITCPHKDCFVPDGIKSYYRVIKSNKINSDCFLPTKIKGDRPLPEGYDACIGKSVSIYDDLAGIINGYFKLPYNKGKKRRICILKLSPNDGVLKQTFDNKSHHSWWRSKVFDLSAVKVQEIEL